MKVVARLSILTSPEWATNGACDLTVYVSHVHVLQVVNFSLQFVTTTIILIRSLLICVPLPQF